MKLIRIVLGYFVLAIEKLFAPPRKTRSRKEAALLDTKLSGLSLYEFRTCPFCMKVRWAMRRLGIDIPLKDAQHDAQARQELLTQGGGLKVPCLRIQSKDGSSSWMYESKDIISHLESLCDPSGAPELTTARNPIS